MIGEIRVVDDVAESFAELAAAEIAGHLRAREPDAAPFRLACSGGASGTRCAAALAAREDVAWSSLVCYFVDERCVAPDAPESNERAIRSALGARVGQLAGFHPMSCTDGAAAYERTLRAAGGLDLVQLGFGPDGHTASLFPGSEALDAPPDKLVVTNFDPSGHNALPRLTLTYAGISSARLAVFTVTGAEKRHALASVVAGGDLPAARVRAQRIVWLCDRPAIGDVLG